MLSWQVVPCPVCKQKMGSKCRTLKTYRITDTHVPRMAAYDEYRRQLIREARR